MKVGKRNHANRWVPHPIIAVFSMTGETFFQHAKSGLFAYAAVSTVELLVRRRSGGYSAGSERADLALWARVITIFLLPWVMFVLCYSLPAFTTAHLPTGIEVAYANVVLLVGAVLIVLEHSIERRTFTPLARVLIVLLLALSVFEMVVFSLRVPDAPFF